MSKTTLFIRVSLAITLVQNFPRIVFTLTKATRDNEVYFTSSVQMMIINIIYSKHICIKQNFPENVFLCFFTKVNNASQP